MTTICLLIPVSSREELRPLRRGPAGWARNRLRRALDRLAWRVGRTPAFHYSTYRDCHETNRGDIAIRRASVELLRAACGPAVAVRDIGWHELPGLGAAWIDAHADLLVIGGGGYFFLDAAGGIAERVRADAALLRQLRCPVASLAPGVNRNLPTGTADSGFAAAGPLPPETAAALGEVLAVLRLSSARDGHSREVLERVAPGRTRVLADPALFLTPAAPPRLPPALPPGTLAIGLNLAFHSGEQSEVLPRRLRLLATAMRALAQRRRCAFFYFVHDQAERAIPPLLRDLGLPATVVDLPAEQMLPWYARLDLHVCQMLHSSILACNAGVPPVVLGYDVKNAAFLELMGLARFCVPEADTDAARLGALVEAALQQRQALARHIAGRTAALRREMEAYLAEIAALLPATPPLR